MGYRTVTLISGANTVIVLEIKVIISHNNNNNNDNFTLQIQSTNLVQH